MGCSGTYVQNRHAKRQLNPGRLKIVNKAFQLSFLWKEGRASCADVCSILIGLTPKIKKDLPQGFKSWNSHSILVATTARPSKPTTSQSLPKELCSQLGWLCPPWPSRTPKKEEPCLGAKQESWVGMGETAVQRLWMSGFLLKWQNYSFIKDSSGSYEWRRQHVCKPHSVPMSKGWTPLVPTHKNPGATVLVTG